MKTQLTPPAGSPASHTPTPWTHQGYVIRDANRKLVANTFGDDSRANAEFIVRACNSHAAIVEALVTTLEIATRYCSHGDELGGKYNDAKLAKARAALSAAKEGQL